MSHGTATLWESPGELANRLIVAGPHWGKGDPHLSLPWFALLAETAMPSGVSLLCEDCSQIEPGASHLLLMRSNDMPGMVTSLSNFYSPLFGLVGEEVVSPEKLTGILARLRLAKPRIHEVRCAPLDTASRSWQLLRQAFRQAGWLIDDYFCFGNWYHQVAPGGFAGYFERLDSRLRNTIRRGEKKIAKTPGARVQIFDGNESDLASAIEAFVAVYNRSWKKPEPFPAFIPGLCRLAAANNGLRLGLVWLDEQPIAAQLWLVANGKAHIVKLAYDQDFPGFSVGTVLTAALFRHVIDVDRVSEIDYLIGDDPYKSDWMSSRRERRGVVAFNPSAVRGWWHAAKHHLGKLR